MDLSGSSGGMSGGGVLGGLLSGWIGSNVAQNQKVMAEQAFGQSDPFAQYRQSQISSLLKLQTDPSSFLKDPMFQASVDQGMKGVERTMAAQGFLGSGNEATALMKYGQSAAWDMMMQQQAFLGQTSGALWQPNFDSAMKGMTGYADTASAATKSGVGGLAGALSFFGL